MSAVTRPLRAARAGLAVVVFLILGLTQARAGEGTPSLSWRGEAGRTDWTWEIAFPEARSIAALRQSLGDHDFVLRHAPRDYAWQFLDEAGKWRAFPGGRVAGERRLFREFPARRPINARALRLRVTRADDGPPAVRELEVVPPSEREAHRPTPWILVVNSTEDSQLPGHGQEFIPLARSCPGWRDLRAQQVWVTDLDPDLLAADPRPLAIFFSGSFKDWCEVDRAHWRGAERVLKAGRTPIWASCGGAQALAILADRGTARPWDCPHCRDPKHPALPVYGHIGHRHEGPHACGDYGDCVFERGPHAIHQLGADPVFAGLSETFTAMESHCGQIEYPPRGWHIVAEGGPGTRTRNQCLRWGRHPVYAAQFHIEMAGTPEVSRAIMANFLGLAAGE